MANVVELIGNCFAVSGDGKMSGSCESIVDYHFTVPTIK